MNRNIMNKFDDNFRIDRLGGTGKSRNICDTSSNDKGKTLSEK